MLPTAVTAFVVLGVGENGLLALFALLVLVLGGLLLWRPGEAPILIYIFGFQWLQASTSIFYANWLGLPLDQVSEHRGNITLATILSLTGLLALSLGMRVAAGPSRAYDVQIAWYTAKRQTPYWWFQLFLISWAGAVVAQTLALIVPGLSQPLLALANLKWAAFVVFTFTTFSRSDGNRVLWLIVFLIELVISMGGYFSSFKFVFLYSLIGILATGVRLSTTKIIGVVAFGAVLFSFGLMWTAVKVDYRNFVSGGQNAQFVTVDYPQRIGHLSKLVSELDGQRLTEATGQLVRRIAYVEFLGVVLNQVPRSIPHENGALWFDAVTRPFMPRLFFPNKTAIDESARTNKYTWLGVSGWERGTQISIGYIGESYIDFGLFGMMGPIFLLGFLLGRIYRWLTRDPNSRGVIGMGLASAVIMNAAHLETSAAKTVGALFVSVLVSWLLIRYFVPWFLPSLRVPETQR
jgi:hypothetical protein